MKDATSTPILFVREPYPLRTTPTSSELKLLPGCFDFSTGLIPGPKSYFLDFKNVFVTACGTNFFDECLPPQSVNLGFSATAFHWLSRKPCNITGALHQPMITVKDEAEKFEEQAAKDWETILLARAKELAPGKALLLLLLFVVVIVVVAAAFIVLL